MSITVNLRRCAPVLLLSATALLCACDRQPSTPPVPSAATPTPPASAVSRATKSSDSLPAGIVPTPPSTTLKASGSKGPSDGASAIGGSTAHPSAIGTPAPQGNAPEPTAGDGTTPLKR